MGNTINILIDNLLATFWRLLDLPVYALLILLFGILFSVNLILLRLRKKSSTKKVWLINGVIVLVAVVLLVDKKISNLKKENDALNDKYAKAIMGQTSINKVNKVYHLDSLVQLLPGANISEKPINQAIDLITIRQRNPNSMSFISIVDLNNPQVVINITEAKNEKILTSTFAKETNSILAINGEAGETPHMDAPLGEWTGNWVSKGNPVLLADSENRPFMSFSKFNEGHYYKQEIVDTVLTEEKYNTIWGRFDILIEGQTVKFENDKQYARTIMGLNQEGNLLYLMVVDGKRPQYSLGLEYYKCANILKSLGAYNVMSCDQGGSSTMYLESLGGVVNRPGDAGGMERPIYSHFGISLK